MVANEFDKLIHRQFPDSTKLLIQHFRLSLDRLLPSKFFTPKIYFLTGDGAWSDWEEWGTCSLTCGDGTKTRSRTCDNPAPSNGGADCAGDAVDTEACNDGACPGIKIRFQINLIVTMKVHGSVTNQLQN